jgi:hypothetical protein
MIGTLLNCKTPGECLKALVFYLILVLVYILFVRFLWNTALVKHITILRPATTLLDTLILSIALSLIVPRSA